MSFSSTKYLADADELRVRISAMNFLARREHSEAELTSKLLTKGADSNLVYEVITQLKSENLQSDQRFVESLINLHVLKGKGMKRLELELKKHDIDLDCLYRTCDELQINWDSVAFDTFTKKFGLYVEDDFAKKAKQMRFMQSRGFEMRNINNVFEKIKTKLKAV